MSWTPHATVAVIIEQKGLFLMVEEIDNGQHVFNQPAGHVEEGETFEQAAIRETLEETGLNVALTDLVGLYTCEGSDGVTYHRLCYVASILSAEPNYQLDNDIVRTLWMSREELIAQFDQIRSPLVLACIDDYLDNRRFPVNFVRNI